ncbi:MAG: DUF2188 domain-containing protein [Bacteroidetes bacterium]|nr:DUF2188 domain-containing protein [Bacteroidota bacterium]
MPWTNKNYPVSMKNLPVRTREKAIEIANALLERNVDEGIAIATGIKNAKEWIRRRYYTRALL